MQKACRLSHMTGFRTGVSNILGPTNANAVFGFWDPMCVFIESLIALDQWYNRVDYRAEVTGDEDLSGGI
jgi:hypothetical protein